MSVNLKIREAQREDMKGLRKMIQDLADYEEMPEGPQLTDEILKNDSFDTIPPLFKCYLLEDNGNTNSFVGYTMFFTLYSTWYGKNLMMEDLYVHKDHRREGFGTKFLSKLAKYSTENNYSYIYFNVLDWNPARNFYYASGAENLTETEKRFRFRLPLNELKSITITPSDVSIRSTERDEVDKLYSLITEHAEECKMIDYVHLNKNTLEKDGFDANPPQYCSFLATINNGDVIGYVVICNIYSTWLGKSLMVDDMYVQPKYRDIGMKTLLEFITKYAIDSDYNRVDINMVETDAAIECYEKFGAVNINKTENWLNHRLTKVSVLKLSENQ